MPREKTSQEEMIRRLKEVTIDEAKYFPGVLGDPDSFAARWVLTTSKAYRRFKKLERIVGHTKGAGSAAECAGGQGGKRNSKLV